MIPISGESRGGVAERSALGGPIHVATATDAAYLPYVAALAGSLRTGCPAGTGLTLSVVCAGIDAGDRARVERSAPGVEIRWYPVDRAATSLRGADLAEFAARPHYFRCLLPDLLPLPRVIYLDADTLVRADLTPLWEADLGGAPVGAVTDSLGTVRRAIGPWQRLGLDGDAGYFNSGVLLIDLDAWRDGDAGWAAIRRSALDRDHLLAGGRWPQHDQYGLNVVFHRRWHPLPQTWNHFTYLPHRPAAVLHFLGSSGRPGSPYCHPRYTRAFLAAVDRTAWRGWRPDSLRPGWLRRALWKRTRRMLDRVTP